jgi:CheY-like chemotaxis protein/anti-sigma regulatory factor (Ser/Thr protein kinase)
MTMVLIVDDSPVDRQLAGRLLAKGPGGTDADYHTDLVPVYATNGREGLDAIAREKPEVVLTDMQMPDMTGLDLVLEVRANYPALPVILMTAHGSEELAVQALRSGAASYVPKRNLARDLRATIESVLEAAQAQRRHHRLLECLRQTEAHFELDNDPAMIPPLVGHMKDGLAVMGRADETTLIRATIALREAILNAMDHGNLELDSALRDGDDGAYYRLGQERRRQKPYCDRRVYVVARESPDESVYIIRDEGPGFDTTRRPDPLDPANLEKVSGRGLLLIRSFMTEVRHNERGNEITLIRRRQAGMSDNG